MKSEKAGRAFGSGSGGGWNGTSRGLGVLAVVAMAARGAAGQELELAIDGVPGQKLGFGVAGMGDVNGDGILDVACTTQEIADPLFFKFRNTIRSGADGATLSEFIVALGPVRTLANAGDVDADGKDDLVFSVVIGSRMDVISGADGSFLFGSGGSAARYGVAGAGDQDGDGHADVASGAPERPVPPFFPVGTGFVEAYCGRTHARRWKTDGTNLGDDFGWSLANPGDIDGDGVDDLLVGAPGFDSSGGSAGYARVLSGTTGAVIFTIPSASGTTGFGQVVAGIRDVDGDSVGDLAVAADSDANGAGSGRVCVHSGASGAPLYAIEGATAGAGLGRSLAGVGDVDGDGSGDLLVGAVETFDTPLAGTAWLVSGRTGLALYSFEGRGDVNLGAAGAAAGDVDGDGRAELWLASPTFDPNAVGGAPGRIARHGGNDLFLDATPTAADAGDFLTQSVRRGEPGKPLIVVIEELDGAPTWILQGGVFFFDAGGSFVTGATVPPGLSGHTVAFRSYALDGTNRLVSTGRETVDLR